MQKRHVAKKMRDSAGDCAMCVSIEQRVASSEVSHQHPHPNTQFVMHMERIHLHSTHNTYNDVLTIYNDSANYGTKS